MNISQKTLMVLALTLALLSCGFFSRSAFAQKPGAKPTNASKDDLGKKLALKYGCLEDNAPNNSKSILLPNGNLLLGICNKIVRLGAANKILWEYETGNVRELLYIPTTNLIYSTNGGSALTILNSTTGKEVDHYAPNGSAEFKDLRPYGTDGFLFITSMADYRERIPESADTLTYWRGKNSVWEIEIPANAEIVAQGSRIIAVTTTKDGIFTKELKIPRK